MIDVRQLDIQLHEKTLLHGINACVEQGEYLVVVGPNGAGKSTLLKALIGIIDTAEGAISYQGKALSRYSQRALARLVSYVPQSSGHALPFDVEEFVKMSRYAHHTALSEWQPEDQAAVDDALRITNTERFRQRQMSTLSGGECQRVMIAAALSQQTPVMLLDEPTSYLDPHHQVEVHQLIARLNRQLGITIIEVSHDINHAGQQGHKVMALAEGQCLWLGDGEAFLDAERLRELYRQDFVFVTHPVSGRRMALADPQ